MVYFNTKLCFFIKVKLTHVRERVFLFRYKSEVYTMDSPFYCMHVDANENADAIIDSYIVALSLDLNTFTNDNNLQYFLFYFFQTVFSTLT